MLAVLLQGRGRMPPTFNFAIRNCPRSSTVGYAVRLLDMNGDKRLDICDCR